MNELLSDDMLEYDPLLPQNHEVGYLTVSLLLHIGLILPLLAAWMSIKSAEPPAPPRVRMHLVQHWHPRPAGSRGHGSRHAQPGSAHPRAIRTGPAGPAHRSAPHSSIAVPERVQEQPSLGQPVLSYPTASGRPAGGGRGGRGGSADPGGSGGGTGGGSGNGSGGSGGGDGDLSGRGTEASGAHPLGFPIDVPAPEQLPRLWHLEVHCDVNAAGRMTSGRVLESSGAPEFDATILEQLKNMSWRPSTRDGVAVDRALTMIFHGGHSPNAKFMTINDESIGR